MAYISFGKLFKLTPERTEQLIHEERNDFIREYDYYQKLFREVERGKRLVTKREQDHLNFIWSINNRSDLEEINTIFPLEDDFLEPEYVETVRDFYEKRIKRLNKIENALPNADWTDLAKKISEGRIFISDFKDAGSWIGGIRRMRERREDCEWDERELEKIKLKEKNEIEEIEQEISNRKEKISLILRLRMLPIELRCRGEKGGVLDQFDLLFDNRWGLLKNLDKKTLMNRLKESKDKIEEQEYRKSTTIKRLERALKELIMFKLNAIAEEKLNQRHLQDHLQSEQQSEQDYYQYWIEEAERTNQEWEYECFICNEYIK